MSEIETPSVASRDAESDESKPRVQTAVRIVSILLAVSMSTNGLKAKEISDQLDLPRQVTYHLLRSLSSTGILRKNGQSRYVLGPAPLQPRKASVDSSHRPRSLPRVSERWLPQRGNILRQRLDGRPDCRLATGRSPVQVAEVPHGYSGHAHARATGKLLLALSPQAMRDEYLAANPLVRLTKRTTTSREDLLKELELIARLGYAVGNEEFTEGLCCLTVPVEGLGSCFALGISVPSERFRANFEHYPAGLRKGARLGVE